MPKKLERVRYSSIFTNAMHNRDQALKLFKSGYSPREIARLFNQVWSLNSGLLSMKYDQVLSDGRKEISIMMSSEKVNDLINQKTRIA